MSDPYLANGKWYIPKDPDDDRFYSADVSKDLADSNTSAVSVISIVQGLTVTRPAEIIVQGEVTKIVVKLTGLDIIANALNFCTFRITCENTEQFDRTIWFVREDH